MIKLYHIVKCIKDVKKCMSKFEFFMKKYYILYIINHKVQKKHMTKEQSKYFTQTISELRSLIENRIKC